MTTIDVTTIDVTTIDVTTIDVTTIDVTSDVTSVRLTREAAPMDFKIELIVLPVSDVDRAKAFYAERAGFTVDVDHQPNDQFRVVQLTPPGSACSVTIGKGLTDAAPGSYRATHLVVTDIVAARDELVGRGVEVSEVRHLENGTWVPGPNPKRGDYESFADFSDPDGNTWVLQEVGHGKQGT